MVKCHMYCFVNAKLRGILIKVNGGEAKLQGLSFEFLSL